MYSPGCSVIFNKMANYKNEKDFLEAIETSGIVSGKYKFITDNDLLMDIEVNNVRFENCEIQGGKFFSAVFNNCTFDKALFRESSLIGTVFKDCDFVECRFSNVEPDFDLDNCKVKLLTVTWETLKVALRPWTKK